MLIETPIILMQLTRSMLSRDACCSAPDRSQSRA